jgi:hypothetical protein
MESGTRVSPRYRTSTNPFKEASMFTPSKRLLTIMATAVLGVAGAAAPTALAKHGADDPAPHHHVGDHVVRAHDHGDRNDVGDDRGNDAIDRDRGGDNDRGDNDRGRHDRTVRAHDRGDRGDVGDVGDDRGNDAIDRDRGGYNDRGDNDRGRHDRAVRAHDRGDRGDVGDDRGGNRGGGRDDGPNHR